MAIPQRVADRLAAGLKRFQPVLESAKSRDVNESDTSMIASDMMAEVFGYDKYTEVTRELCIRGTYCDLATKIDGKFQMLIEVKPIGVDIKDSHARQAVDYAANSGIEWVTVTTGVQWRVFRVIFGKPIDQEMVIDLNFQNLNARSSEDLEQLFLLTRESIVKSALNAYHDHLQATSRFFLGAIILSDPVLETVRRELRRVSADVKVSVDELREAIRQDVLKREVIEGEKADGARKRVARAATKMLRVKREREDEASAEPPATALPEVES